ncbi:hypothetical protein pipiens_005801 [Culex pipiens pipiens]|uniref:MADF domain-containing protein n=1 Tax=Culex pipiens pipiens TaxID=38569 RepID=A0ABD1DTP1_CULPP
MRRQCVEGAWTEIASALDKDVQWCIDKWRNLQRNYRNFLNKENLPSGSGANNRGRPKFAFAQQMSFLIEHIQPKATKSNFSQQEKSPEPFNGRNSSDRFAGETQSSKLFRGLTQSELAGNVIDVDYDVFLRDTLNLSPPKQPEEQPHCSYNPPKGYKSYEKELSSIAGRGGKQKAGEAEGGSSNKKIRRDNFPAPTYEQIVSRIKLGIMPAGYPDAELTPEQQEVVKDELLKKVLEQRREQFKPKFVYCKAKAGLVMLLCQEKGTADWVKLTVPTMIPWENAQLSALNEADIPRRDVLRAFFYRSKNDENDTILGYLESQNDNLDTSAWKILRRSVKVNDHVAWLFTVDLASMQLLEERNFVVNYKFGQTMFRRKQSDNEIHPADDDSDEDMDKDIFDEGLSSDVLAHESVSSRPSGNGTTDGLLDGPQGVERTGFRERFFQT